VRSAGLEVTAAVSAKDRIAESRRKANAKRREDRRQFVEQAKALRCVLHEECKADETMGKACFREQVARIATMSANEAKTAAAALMITRCPRCRFPTSIHRHTCSLRRKDRT
jgi:hypothetical protein